MSNNFSFNETAEELLSKNSYLEAVNIDLRERNAWQSKEITRQDQIAEMSYTDVTTQRPYKELADKLKTVREQLYVAMQDLTLAKNANNCIKTFMHTIAEIVGAKAGDDIAEVVKRMHTNALNFESQNFRLTMDNDNLASLNRQMNRTNVTQAERLARFNKAFDALTDSLKASPKPTQWGTTRPSV